jgi:hypothetical protein
MSKSNNSTTFYSDVIPGNLSATELTETKDSKGQKIAFIRYDDAKRGADAPLFIQLPKIYISQGGVPKRDAKYYTEDHMRGFANVPLDDTIPESKSVMEAFASWDEQFSSPAFAQKLLGPKFNKYKYKSLISYPVEDEDADPKKIKRLPSIKVRLDLSYPDNNIKTVVYNATTGDDGKIIRTKAEGINTIDDFSRHFRWKSNARMIIRFAKIWAHPPTKKDPEYGVILKMVKVEVEAPSEGKSSVKAYLENDTFLDSDDEETPKKQTKAAAPSAPIKTKQAVAQVDSSDDEEEVKTVTSTTKSKPVVMVESDSSDQESDDESDKPAPVQTKGKAAAKAPVKSKKASA